MTWLTAIDELKAWVKANDPELYARLGPMHLPQAMHELNEITGLNVVAGDTVEDGARRFLVALKAIDAIVKHEFGAPGDPLYDLINRKEK